MSLLQWDSTYPASPMQQGLWFAEQKAGGAALHHTAALLHLRGALDVLALEQALSLVLHQHPVLRTTLHFAVKTRALLARLQGFKPVFLPAETVTPQQLAAKARQLTASALALDECLYRFHLFRVSRQQHALLLCFHQAVTDGRSLGVISQSLAQAYNKLRRDPAWQVRNIDTGFLQYCQQLHASADARYTASLAWWQQHLPSARLARIQGDRHAESGAKSRAGKDAETRVASVMERAVDSRTGLGQERSIEWPFATRTRQCLLPAQTLEQLRARCRQRHLTLFAGMLTALKWALAQYTGRPQQIVGFPVAERNMASREHSVGCFVNGLLTCDVIDSATPADVLLQQVHDNVQAAFMHAMPLQRLVARLRPPLLPGGNAWFEVLFVVRNLPSWSARFDELSMQVERVDTSCGQYPLKVEVLPGPDQWQLRMEYARACFSESDIGALGRLLQRAFAAVALA